MDPLDIPPDLLRIDPARMRELGYWVVDRVIEHLETLEVQPALVTGDEHALRTAVDAGLPRAGHDIASDLRTLADVVLAHQQHGDHPRYFARVPSAGEAAARAHVGHQHERVGVGSGPGGGACTPRPRRHRSIVPADRRGRRSLARRRSPGYALAAGRTRQWPTSGAGGIAGTALMLQIHAAEFEELVAEALDSIPEALADLMDNVVILQEDEAPADDPELLGLYEGVPLVERGVSYVGADLLPDTITIFRLPILRICETQEDVVREVRVTVVHEIAHHFGIDDDRLHELGWG